MNKFSKIILFPRHKLYKCGGNTLACIENRCAFCAGGLTACITCNGAEGSLPTECPQHPMTHEEQDAVYDETIDFKNGRWIKLDKIGKSM